MSASELPHLVEGLRISEGSSSSSSSSSAPKIKKDRFAKYEKALMEGKKSAEDLDSLCRSAFFCLNEESRVATKGLVKVPSMSDIDLYSDVTPFEHTVARYGSEGRISGSIMPWKGVAMSGVTFKNVSNVVGYILEHRIPLIVRLTAHTEIDEKSNELRFKSRDWIRNGRVLDVTLKVTQVSDPRILSVRGKAVVSLITTCFELVKEGNVQAVKELYIENWNDFSVVPADAVINAIKAFREESEGHEGGTFIAHCSGGIGRTGVFFTCKKIMDEIDQGNDPVVHEIIQELRKARDNGFVTTLGQFQLCYEVKKLYLEQKRAEQQQSLVLDTVQE